MLRNRRHFLGLAALLLASTSISLAQTTAPTTAPATRDPAKPPFILEAAREISSLPSAVLAPKTAADLKAIQSRVEAVAKLALPATVGLQMLDGQGSGVIISKDGYVLTAGHVSGKPGADVMVILSNGSRVRAKSLGANNGIDSGLVKITAPGDYPFVPVGTTVGLIPGQWVIAMGHPGGVQQGRPPVVRLGRVLSILRNQAGPTAVMTDCTLINGDSGGPVFDLDGRVIGINSKIGVQVTSNFHVPIDTFISTWDRLAKGEEWGNKKLIPASLPPAAKVADLGISGRMDDTPKGPAVLRVRPDTGADKAGMLDGDVITKFNGEAVRTEEDVQRQMLKAKPGDVVALDILRGNAAKKLSVKLGEKVSKE